MFKLSTLLIQVLWIYPLMTYREAAFKLKKFFIELKQGRLFTKREPTEGESKELLDATSDDSYFRITLSNGEVTQSLIRDAATIRLPQGFFDTTKHKEYV